MTEEWAEVMKQATSLPDEELFELTLAIDPYDSLQTNRVFWINELARRGGPQIVDRALQLARSSDVTEQCVGIDLLSDLGQLYEMLATDECVNVLISAAESTTTLITELAIHALGNFAPVRALPMILEKSEHSDEWVRVAVARALWSFFDQPVGDSNDVVKVLLRLTRDGFYLVRDSATFSLGLLANADGPLIRDAFADRLDDSDEDTRTGALASLARRRDSRAITPLFAALQRGETNRQVLEAAAFLADPALFPLLCNLPADGSQELARAKERCSTKAMLESYDNIRTFAELASRRGLDLVLYSNLLSDEGPQLSQPKRMDLSWDFEALLDRAEGDVARMVDLAEFDIANG